MRISIALTILLTGTLLSAAPKLSAQSASDTAMMAPAQTTDTVMMDDGSTQTMKVHKGMHFNTTDDGTRVLPTRKWYLSAGFDAALLQTAFFRRPGHNNEFTYLRFSYFVNLGVDFNYDFDNNFGIFTGLGIKNIGFTQKESDSTIKRRVYTIGAPLGLKIGDLGKRKYLIIGGGIDVPFNYREKGWTSRAHKHKMNEWFSDRTEDYMPYLFVGASIKRNVSVKLQYYPGNFMNNQYEQTASDGSKSKPFYGWDTHLLFLSLGLDLQGKKKMNAGRQMTPPPPSE